MSAQKENDKPKRQTHSAQAPLPIGPISPSLFFDNPPPLPVPPPRRAGSSHTNVAFYPPPSSPQTQLKPAVPSPPPYDENIPMDEEYRPPEAVPPSPPSSVPDLVSAQAEWGHVEPSWGDIEDCNWDPPSSETTTRAIDYRAWGDNGTGWPPPEEPAPNPWWDHTAPDLKDKPGPGVLPPGLAERLHSGRGYHSLLRAAVSPPTTAEIATRQAVTTPGPTGEVPTREQVAHAVPHPHAMFCPKENVWLYFQIRHSAHLPTLVVRPQRRRHSPDKLWSKPIPPLEGRKEHSNCLEVVKAPYGSRVRTHHFHHYPRSVQGSTLDPPFTHRTLKTNFSTGDAIGTDAEEVVEEIWLDAWICCQCQMHVLCTGTGESMVQGLVDRSAFDEYVNDRYSNPLPGRTSPESVMYGLETILKYVKRRLTVVIYFLHGPQDG